MAAVSWYTTALDLSIRERGTIELPAALRIVDEYFDRLKPSYASGEEALSETTFGFSRAEDDFIEICLHGPTQISLNAELPASGGFIARLRGPSRKQLSLNSREALKRHVSGYFTLSPEAFRAQLAAGQGS